MKLITRLIVLLSLAAGVSSCKKDPIMREPPVVTIPDGVGDEIPYISIDTRGNYIIDDPKISADMSIWYSNTNILNNPIGVEFRGSSSQIEFNKKSYGIELRDQFNMDTALVLLDLPKEEDWALIGPFSDKTMLRNIIPYQLANEMQYYAPKTKVVELGINNIYQGIYVLTEKIKRDKNRVNISKLEPNDNTANVISGGYILKIDKATGEGGDNFSYEPNFSFRSDYDTKGEVLAYPPYDFKRSEETYFIYEYPKATAITNPQKNYIQEYIANFEQALIEEDFITENRTYFDYIDIQSFVDNFILNELTGNPDAYRLSSFLYKDRGGKLFFGPIWDYNLSLGNDNRSIATRWVYQYNSFYPNDLWLVHFWWTKILSDPKVKLLIKDRWQSLRGDVLNNQNIFQLISSHQTLLQSSNSINRNYERWDVINIFLPYNGQVAGSYEGEIKHMNQWLNTRLSWMDDQINAW